MSRGSYTLVQARSMLERMRDGKRVVLTAGTFDILHLGHLDFLKWAKTQGDLLAVCVIGDRRTRRRKGPGRPIVREDWRALMVSSLKPVDLVFISNRRPFEEPIIRALRPDVVVTTLDEPTGEKKADFASYFRAKHPEIQLVMRKRNSFRRKTSTKIIIEKVKRI